MKEVMIVFLIFGLIFTACDTELGHEDHDHDGDGIQDHDAEDHDDDHSDDDHEEENSVNSSN